MRPSPAFAYRSDIDGLRAVAVIAVVLYHFGIGGIAGGFVGVDVFFVISGFLITGIIQREIEQGRFTFAGFYERRIRRIFPALFVVLAATLLAGYFILLPSDLVLLGKSTLATLVFGSNVLFWRTSGYFDMTSELNPLLHTWSLAVEEQFYIGLPILLILIFRYARSSLRLLLIAGMLISLLACLWVQELRPEAAFYLSPFRAWELLIGSLLAIGNIPQMSNPMARESIAWSGAVILLASILFIPKGPDFPSWMAVGPVIGTAAIMYAGGSGPTVVGRFLSWRPVVYIGLISYSLYLWHWPVVVFTKYLNALDPIGALAYVGVALSILLAAGSYVWIEKPIRVNKKVFSRRILMSGAISGTAFLGVISLWLFVEKGIPTRFSPEVVEMDAERNPNIPFINCVKSSKFDNPKDAVCVLGDSTVSPSVLIWGDSHALSWAPAFNEIFKEKNISGLLAFKPACPPLLGIKNPVSFSCYENNKNIHEYISEKKTIDAVILVASWTSYSNNSGQYVIENDSGVKGNEIIFASSLKNTVSVLQRENKRVLLIGPTPGAPDDIPLMMTFVKYRGIDYPKAKSIRDVKNQSAQFYLAANEIQNIALINPELWLCNSIECIYKYNGFPLYRDGGHLNVHGAMFLKNKLQINFIDVLNQTK